MADFFDPRCTGKTAFATKGEALLVLRRRQRRFSPPAWLCRITSGSRPSQRRYSRTSGCIGSRLDPNFVRNLRQGREVRPETDELVRSHLVKMRRLLSGAIIANPNQSRYSLAASFSEKAVCPRQINQTENIHV